MAIDFVFNGQSSGKVFDKLLAHNNDPGSLRPWMDPDNGRCYITVNNKGKQEVVRVANADTVLTRDAWKQIDTAILKAARKPLAIVSDLRGAGLTYGIPGGIGKTVLEGQTMSDINDATMDMDGLNLGADDRPVFATTYLPLPIIHFDFQFTLRQIQASRDGGAPLDTTMAEMAGRKVSEYLEKLVLGKLSTYAYAGGTIYGLTNWTSVLTQTMTTPTGANMSTTLSEILTMKETSKTSKHYGPWNLYFSPAWDKYLDNDYNTSYPNMTLRQRLAQIDGIGTVKTLNWLTSYDTILLEMNPEVIRMVVGMEIMTLQWDDSGGLRKNFKVMTIQVPQLRKDYNDCTGIVYGSI